jgi:cytochrome P450
MLLSNPTSDIDLYSDTSLLEPYENYKVLRDSGPLVFLNNLDMYVAARYKDVKEIMATPEVFISGKGVTMNDIVNEALKGIGLCSDGVEHRRIRKVESRPLSPRALRDLGDTMKAEAEVVVDRILKEKSFDAVADLAHALPLSIVSNLVGLPEEGREHMLEWAAGNFNSFGPMNERTTRSLSVFEEMVNYAMTQCVPGKLKPGSWAAMLHDAADAGEVSEQEARLMALSYVGPSLDTTIFGISSAIWLFANHPEQWTLLRENPSLVPNAINECLRIESPIQGFSRYAASEYSFDGAVLPAGSRVIILWGSANRDERRWEDPDTFNVRRDRVGDHVAFGYGEHACIGSHLARVEMAALLNALLPRVTRFTEISSERAINSTLRGFEKLQISVT